MRLVKAVITKATLRCCAGAVVGLALYGCGAADDLDATAEGPLGTVEEALTPAFELVERSGVGEAIVTCPSDKRFVLGTGGETPANPGLQTIKPLEPTNPMRLMVTSGIATGNTAKAVCSNVPGTRKSASSTTTTKVVMCPEGEVAVGGGGDCDGDGMLYRSRPSPDDDGSTPRGWAAGCTSGPVQTYAICVDEDVADEFASCRTERVDGPGSVQVSCPVNFTALSIGGYCGDNRPIFDLDIRPDLKGGKVSCFGASRAHAYAVCCG
jgi:hypothetical protein